MQKLFFIITLIICSLCSHSQNYIEYARIKYLAKEALIDENPQKAAIYYDSLYNNFNFMYAYDCFTALKVAVKNNDSLKAKKFLLKSIEMGVPVKMIDNNYFISKNLKFNLWKNVSQNCIDSLRSIYENRIDYEMIAKIDSMAMLDQTATKKVNKSNLYNSKWRKQVTKNAKLLKEIVKSYGMPEEKLLGIEEKYNKSGKIVENNEPNRGASYIFLIHYFSNPVDDLYEWKNLLLTEVKKGNLQPYQFGAICDFIAKYSIKGDITGKDGKFYSVWHYDPKPVRINEVNKRREELGLPNFNYNLKYEKYRISFYNNHKNDSVIFISEWD